MALPLALRNRLAELILDALHDTGAREALTAVVKVCGNPHALESAGPLPEAFPEDMFDRREGGWHIASGYRPHAGELPARAEAARAGGARATDPPRASVRSSRSAPRHRPRLGSPPLPCAPLLRGARAARAVLAARRGRRSRGAPGPDPGRGRLRSPRQRQRERRA